MPTDDTTDRNRPSDSRDDPAPIFPPTRPEDVYGCLGRSETKPVTIEEMDEAVATEFRRQHALGRY
jgi:hypothetical protein